jgi:hypothetical protein
MNALKIVFLVAVLLLVGIIAGCQGGYARQDSQWEPTGTGFWRPVVTPPIDAK